VRSLLPAPGNMLLMEDLYARYIAICNAHRFELLDELVAQDVRVDGTFRGLDRYIADLQTLVDIFPDYHWELQHLVVDGAWMAAHLLDTGTQALAFGGVAPAGCRFAVADFALYQLHERRIVEVRARTDERAMIDQLRGAA
jgi:predicted ester cyclase